MFILHLELRMIILKLTNHKTQEINFLIFLNMASVKLPTISMSMAQNTCLIYQESLSSSV